MPAKTEKRPTTKRRTASTASTSLTAHRLAKQADAAIAAEQSQPEPEPVVVQVVIVFHVEGQAVAHLPLVGQVGRPADDQALQLQIGLDARALLQWLEPHIGPSAASASAPPMAKLWTPGK